MPLLIDNRIAEQALTMNDAIEAMENALKQLAEGDAVYQPRTDLWSPTATVGDYFRWGSLLGAIKDPPVLAFRFKLDIMTWQEYGARSRALVQRRARQVLRHHPAGGHPAPASCCAS